jgi:LPS-assembly lipoprotein|tara:strand:- start:980 stop:1474 length:495 start_codon:yes stop_codon:yes gene_type:complete
MLGIWILCSLLSSCGFHLRGLGEFPTWLKPKVAIILEDEARDWESYLKPLLSAGDIQVTSDPKQAPFWLFIEQERLDQNISSVSSSSTPRQYQLHYAVTFRLENNRGKTLIPSRSVVVNRPLTINNERILGSRNESEKLKRAMKHDAAIQIIYCLNRYTPSGYK